MSVYFVSRHPGAQFWARHHDARGSLPLRIDHYVEHFDPEAVLPGDVVIGTLPLAAIARLQSRGGQFVALDIATPPAQRGQELTATEMQALGATLTPYRVEALDARRVTPKPAPAPAAAPQRSLTLMLVSDQLPPQLIGLDLHPSTDVWLVSTPSMHARSELLELLLKALPTPHAVCTKSIENGSYTALREKADRLLDDAAREGFGRIVLNATGGTKLMSLAFTQAATDAQRRGVPAEVYYVDTATQTAEGFGDAAPLPLRRALNIDQLIRCSGRWLAGASHPSPEFQGQMKRSALHRHLLAAPEWVIGALNKCASEDGVETRGMVSLDAALARALLRGHARGQPPLVEQLLDAGVLAEGSDVRLEDRTLTLRSPAELDYLRGGWLEAHLASCLAASGADDWAAGLQVSGQKDNELDGVVAAGNRLLVIETKTNNQSRRESGAGDGRNTAAEQAVYKLDSLGGQLARSFGERWYVSARPLDVADLERATSLRIRVFAPNAGKRGEPLSALPKALHEWVQHSGAGMTLSPGFKRSQVGTDNKRWGAARTRPYSRAATGSFKADQAAQLLNFKRQLKTTG